MMDTANNGLLSISRLLPSSRKDFANSVRNTANTLPAIAANNANVEEDIVDLAENLLGKLKLIYPAWRASLGKTDESYKTARKEWVLMILKYQITPKTWKLGLSKARNDESNYLPKPVIFAKWCNANLDGIPLESEAKIECQKLAGKIIYNQRVDYSHPIIKVLISKVGTNNLISLKDYTLKDLFHQEYQGLIKSIIKGENIYPDENQNFIENNADQGNECYQAYAQIKLQQGAVAAQVYKGQMAARGIAIHKNRQDTVTTPFDVDAFINGLSGGEVKEEQPKYIKPNKAKPANAIKKISDEDQAIIKRFNNMQEHKLKGCIEEYFNLMISKVSGRQRYMQLMNMAKKVMHERFPAEILV